MMTQTSLLCLGLIVVSAPARAQETPQNVVRKLAEEIGKATIAGDFAKVIDQTYPTAIEQIGGREKAIEITTNSMKQMKAQGISVEKFEAGEPSKPSTASSNTFVVVPTVVEMKLPVGRVRVKSFMLGISTDGQKTWKFLDGAGLQKKDFRGKMLPKLPADLKLPEISKPEFVPAR